MMETHTGSQFARSLRKHFASNCQGFLKMLSNRLDPLKSKDPSQLKSTRHTRNRFAKHLENIP